MYELVEQIISIVCRRSRNENRRLSFSSVEKSSGLNFFQASFSSQTLEHLFQASKDKRYLELESSALLDFVRKLEVAALFAL